LHSSKKLPTWYSCFSLESNIRRKKFFQEIMQETLEGDFENLADIELTDILDPIGL
jgi:hypothetical protein